MRLTCASSSPVVAKESVILHQTYLRLLNGVRDVFYLRVETAKQFLGLLLGHKKLVRLRLLALPALVYQVIFEQVFAQVPLAPETEVAAIGTLRARIARLWGIHNIFAVQILGKVIVGVGFGSGKCLQRGGLARIVIFTSGLSLEV